MEGSSKQKNGRVLPWQAPRSAFPVFRKYVSQLELMRKRHNEEENMAKSNRAFWVAWNSIQMKVSKEFANEEWDTQQYEAEVELFKKFWPGEFFPGQCPNQYYVSHLKHIEQKAYASGIPRSVFDHICDHIARCRFEDTEPDADIKQYRSESSLWSHFWPKEKFPGIQPYPNRAAHAPVSIISSRPAPSSIEYYNYSIGLAEHQQFQEQVPAEGANDVPDSDVFIKKENVSLDEMATVFGGLNSLPPKPLQGSSNIPKAGAPGPIPAFATGANSSSVASMPTPNTINAPYVSRLSNENDPSNLAQKLALGSSTKAHIAAVDSLLGYISKDLNLMVALSKALGCKVSSDKVPGSTDLTWIFVEAWPEWEGCDTQLQVLDRAHSFVEKWCHFGVEDFFKEIASTHDGDEGDRAGARKKRRLV